MEPFIHKIIIKEEKTLATKKRHNRKKIIIINICIALFCLVLVLLGWSLRIILLPFLVGILLSYIINPAVTALGKKNVPIGAAVVIIYLYIFLGIYCLLAFMLPNILGEVDTLLAAIPQFIEQGQGLLGGNIADSESMPFVQDLLGSADSLSDKVTSYLNNMMNEMVENIKQSFSYIITFLFAPILSYYMLRDKDIIKKKIIAFLPPKQRPEMLRIADDVDHILHQFIYGYLFVAVIVGVMSGVALAILGVEYAMVLGIIMIIADLIPYFGPFLGILISMAFALVDSPTLAIYVLIVLGAIQQFENFVLTPKIIGFRTGLHPLTVIFVVLAGGHWFGILGMIFSVPVTAALKLILSVIYSKLVAFKDRNQETILETQTGMEEKELNNVIVEEIIKKS